MCSGSASERALQVAAKAVTQESAIATRARGCQTWARASRVCARSRSPPMPSKPSAPTHLVPGASRSGATCGLAARKAAVTRAVSRSIAGESHIRDSRAAHFARACATVIPARTPSLVAAEVAMRTRVPSVSARGCSSQLQMEDGRGKGEDDSALGIVGLGEATAADADAGARGVPGAVPRAIPGDGTTGLRLSCASHTAPIGNLGMRTQATRDSFADVMAELQLHVGIRAALLERRGDGGARSRRES